MVSPLIGFPIWYDAEADSLAGALPVSARYGRELPLPFSGWLYFTVVAAETVANNKVAVDVIGIVQTVEGNKLFYVARPGAAIGNFYMTPSVGTLAEAVANGIFDWINTMACERIRAGGWGIMTQSH